MRLTSIIFALIVPLANSGHGQQLKIQNLKELVAAGKDLSVQISLADSIYRANQFSNLGVAEVFAAEFNRLAELSGKESDKIRALQVRADVFFSQGNFFEAKQLAQKILDAGVVLHNHEVITDGYLRLSESYFYTHRLDFAGFFAARAYDQALEYQEQRSVSDALRLMGLVYSELRQDSAALAAFSKSATVLINDQKYSGNLETLRERARHFKRTQSYDSAKRCLNQLISLARQTGNRLMLGDAFLELFEIEKGADVKRQILDSARNYNGFIPCSLPTSVNQIQDDGKDFQIFPNPAHHAFSLRLNNLIRADEIKNILIINDKGEAKFTSNNFVEKISRV